MALPDCKGGWETSGGAQMQGEGVWAHEVTLCPSVSPATSIPYRGMSPWDGGRLPFAKLLESSVHSLRILTTGTSQESPDQPQEAGISRPKLHVRETD